MTVLSGRFLVRGNGDAAGETSCVSPILHSNVSLSFWGGIDPETGIVIDRTHPLRDQCVADTILCLPSGRGSSTASQVLLELILNKKAPRALVVRDCDGLICVGALVAESVFTEARVLDIIQVGQSDDFKRIADESFSHGRVLNNGNLRLGKRHDDRTFEEASMTEDDKLEATEIALTAKEQRMLDEAKSEAERRAAMCIIRYARIISDDPNYISVSKSHIDGCTYIGPGGLQFVQRLVDEGGRVKIPTTLNSVSTDLRHWERLGIVPTQSQQASIKLANAYLTLGCSERSFTCAPYLLDNPPTIGEQICWGESNAVVYANTVLGARTEKYADYLDICCAIVGKVPAVGAHLDENRIPTILLDATGLNLEFDDPQAFAAFFPILGHLCGILSDGEVPILAGMDKYADRITKDHLKAFCAAYGTTGTSPLIHIDGVTPEAMDAKVRKNMIDGCKRKKLVTPKKLEATMAALNHSAESPTKPGNDAEKIDMIALGNPHLSLSECDELVALVEELPATQRKNEDVQIVACMSRVLYDQSPAIPRLREFGIEFVNDTCWCMLLHPPMIPTDPTATILTNSGKYAHYGPGLTDRNFRLGSTRDCIQAAVTGTMPRMTTKTPWRIQSRSWGSLTRAQEPTGVRSNRMTPDMCALTRNASQILRRIVK